MRRYIRAPQLGGASYFFTLSLAERQNNDLLTRHVHVLRQAFADVRARHPFAMEAVVILPDHLHALWRMPEDDGNYALRWRLIKARFSRQLPRGEQISHSRAAKGERGIWQRRYWEHQIRDEHDWGRHVDYIHYNPVKHGLVTRPTDWPYSSLHRFVREGRMPADWGASAVALAGGFGE